MRKLPIVLVIVLRAVLVVVLAGRFRGRTARWRSRYIVEILGRLTWLSAGRRSCIERAALITGRLTRRRLLVGRTNFGLALCESLVHMLRKEVREDYPERLERLEQLNNTPIHRWPRWFQDAAFYRVANGTPNGLKHWAPRPAACW